MKMKRVRVNPGRTQSMVGFVGGLLFVVLGIVVVIPSFGAFGIIWTLFAGVIAGVNGFNAFSQKGVTSHEILIDDGDSAGTSPAERLETLRDLYERRLITQEEYEKRRAEIIDEL